MPIRFSAYTGGPPNYLVPDGIDPSVASADNLWDRIDWVIAKAENNGLYVILDLHAYEEISDDVAGERTRFLAIWEQISQRYATASPNVLFEVLNEPQGQFNDDPTLLNTLIADALNVIRATNPTRPVLVAPSYWNQIGALESLVLPADPNLIVSVHFYDPFPFTHQGASWIDPVPASPASFEPDFVGFGGGWGDWGWSSTAVPTSNSLAVTFDNQWGGVAFGRATAFAPATLNVEIAGASELAVRCALANDVNTEVTRITTTAAATTFNIDMTACPANTQSINFMVRTPTFDSLNFFEAELCVADGSCSRLIESGTQAIESAFDQAAAWGQANGRPIHVGEFGAYSANGIADLNDRAVWTETVRLAGENRGFSMSYWEFGAGFGVYDPATETWVEPLLTALGVEPLSNPTPSRYVAVPPVRALDTRTTNTPWGPGEIRDVRVVGTDIGVPTGATAVAMHITTVNASASGSNLAVWAADGTPPVNGALLNFGTGAAGHQVTNDLVLAQVSANGNIKVRNKNGTVDLVIEIVGYFSTTEGSGYTAVHPVRALDTRNSTQGAYDTPWGPGETRNVVVASPAFGVSSDATAVALHITTANPTAAGSNLAIWNADRAEPANGAQINFGTGTNVHATTNDLVISEVSATGEVKILNRRGSTDVIVEVVGYYTPTGGDGYVAISPIRALDSRDTNTPWSANEIREVDVVDPSFQVPANATAVALHITSVNPTAPGSNLAIWAAGDTPPANGAQINFGTDTAVHALTNDLVISEISDTGLVSIRNKNGTTDIVVEIIGYYTG